METGPEWKDWGQRIKSKDCRSNPQKSKSRYICIARLLLAAFQGKAETRFSTQAPTVDAGSVMRLEVSCRLLISGYNAGSNTAGLNPFSPALKRMPTGSLPMTQEAIYGLTTIFFFTKKHTCFFVFVKEGLMYSEHNVTWRAPRSRRSIDN